MKTEVKRALLKEQMGTEVKVLSANRSGLKLAVVILPEEDAEKLEELG